MKGFYWNSRPDLSKYRYISDAIEDHNFVGVMEIAKQDSASCCAGVHM